MRSKIKIIFGDARDMREVEDESIQLVVTSPPYYNAPFDFPEMFKDYDEYLELIREVGKEIYRVLEKGRIACFVVQDVRVNGELYPIVADVIKIMKNLKFTYRDKIIWKKPEGYVRISRRSGVLIQHPYPMYFYPDNIYEEIIIFQKGKFNYNKVKKSLKEESKIDLNKFQREKWYLSVWEITNVLPFNKISKYTAAFPEELVERLIRLYSYVGETILDPFLGTGTTAVVARKLNRNCIGYEIDLELKPIIEERLGIGSNIKTLQDFSEDNKDIIEVVIRDDARNLRTHLRKIIEDKLTRKKRKSK